MFFNTSCRLDCSRRAFSLLYFDENCRCNERNFRRFCSVNSLNVFASVVAAFQFCRILDASRRLVEWKSAFACRAAKIDSLKFFIDKFALLMASWVFLTRSGRTGERENVLKLRTRSLVVSVVAGWSVTLEKRTFFAFSLSTGLGASNLSKELKAPSIKPWFDSNASGDGV